MERTWTLRKAKALTGIVAVVVELSGLATGAQAFEFNSGDFVLAIYGNSQEYYRNLGPAANLLVPGAQNTFDLSASPLAPLSATAGNEPIQWTVLSGQGTTQLNTFTNVASQQTSAQIIASGSNNGVVPANTNITSWRNTIGPATGPGSEIVLNAVDPASFTTRFGINGTLGNTFTGGGLQGSLDSVLFLIQGQARTAGGDLNVLSDVGRVMLALNGQLNICGGAGCTPAVIPIPAGIILFGTGLIGLVGIARRKLTLVTG